MAAVDARARRQPSDAQEEILCRMKARNVVAREGACAGRLGQPDRDDLCLVPSLYRGHPNLCLDPSLGKQRCRFEQGVGQSDARVCHQARAAGGGH